MQVQACVYAHTLTHTHQCTHVCACVTYSGNYSHSAHFNSTSKLPPSLQLLILPSSYFHPSLFLLLPSSPFSFRCSFYCCCCCCRFFFAGYCCGKSRKKLLNFTQDFCCSRSVRKFFDCCRFIQFCSQVHWTDHIEKSMNLNAEIYMHILRITCAEYTFDLWPPLNK